MTTENPSRVPFGMTISVNNVNEALPIALDVLKHYGRPSESRGIKTIRANGPVMTVYAQPRERVLFDQVRDANPFFHLIESLWILAGSNRVELPSYFLNGITRFSDDGTTFHGAYGHRLAHAFNFDQLDEVVELLSTKPDTRQAVMSIWHPEKDLGIATKDVPCNDMIMLEIVDGDLNMTVCNRSNDAIWGAYGANAVQFSMIQEWLAISIGVNVGYYVQQSNNFHIYPDNPFWKAFLDGDHAPGHVVNPYMVQKVCPRQIADNPQDAMTVRGDCMLLDARARRGLDLTIEEVYSSRYFHEVVVPLIQSYNAYKRKDYDRAIEISHAIRAEDWRLACTEWLERRKDRASVHWLASSDTTEGGEL